MPNGALTSVSRLYGSWGIIIDIVYLTCRALFRRSAERQKKSPN